MAFGIILSHFVFYVAPTDQNWLRAGSRPSKWQTNHNMSIKQTIRIKQWMREDFELFFSKQSIVTQFCPVFGIVFSLAYHIVTIIITIIRFNHLNNNNRSVTKVPHLYGRFSRLCLSLYTHVESKFQLLHLKSTKSIKNNLHAKHKHTRTKLVCFIDDNKLWDKMNCVKQQTKSCKYKFFRKRFYFYDCMFARCLMMIVAMLYENMCVFVGVRVCSM